MAILICLEGVRLWKMTHGGISVNHGILSSYDYTVYLDHVVLGKYYGSEAEVKIPRTYPFKPVTEIGYHCFYQNKELRCVYLNDKVETIGPYAFGLCTNLEKVLDGTNVKWIKIAAFESANHLAQIEVGNKIEVIDWEAFAGCYELKEFPEQPNLQLIEYAAFYQSGLEKFVFPENTDVERCALMDTPWLLNRKEDFVIFGDGKLQQYKGADQYVKVPEGVKVIQYSAFFYSDASEIYIPRSTEKIEQGAFWSIDNSLKVYIPDSVVNMGYEDEDNLKFIGPEYYIIVTVEGSYAQQFAEKYGFKYKIVDPWW